MANEAEHIIYRVLARKYRPQTFEDLIGQDVMVSTLTNAFSSGRIAQAFMLTGLRGVGKTTTARILARALNFEPLDGKTTDKPSLDMPELGKHCQEIIESRHIDVLEMDAASHTSIDDIREIIENARYRPSTARYKVYIIDEVHMLSKAAFNGLLKTLEEPPPHVKFIFATTEIRKVPTTVLSRCQRYTLARVEVGTLSDHLEKICGLENIACDKEALNIIAQAGEGSVRDALSMLDQAMALSPEKVSTDNVFSMLGLAPKAKIIALFKALVEGKTAEALDELGERYREGDDPATIIADLADFCHLVTRIKVTNQTYDSNAITKDEYDAAQGLSEKLNIKILSILWQMLIKGHEEIMNAPKALAAAEMVIIRLGYTASLPPPETLIRHINDRLAQKTPEPKVLESPKPKPEPEASQAIKQDWVQEILQDQDDDARLISPANKLSDEVPSQDQPKARNDNHQSPAAPPETSEINDLQTLIDMAAGHRDLQTKRWLRASIRLVALANGRLDVELVTPDARSLISSISKKLNTWTGYQWTITTHDSGGALSLHEQAEQAKSERLKSAMNDDNVKRILDTFPEAEIVDVASS